MAQQINLINRDLLPRLDPFVARHVALVALVLFVVLGGSYAVVQIEASTLQAQESATMARQAGLQTELSNATKAVAARKSNPALAKELARTKAILALRQDIIQLLEGGQVGERQGFSDYFKGLARQTMEGVWLTGFAVRGDNLELNGRLLEPSSLPTYMARLNAEEAFRGKRFAALDMLGVEAQNPDKAEPGSALAATDKAKARPLPKFTEFTLRSVLPVATETGGKK